MPLPLIPVLLGTIDVARDDTIAIWIDRAHAGEAMAQLYVAKAYWFNLKNYKEAIYWFERCIATDPYGENGTHAKECLKNLREEMKNK